MIQKTLLLLGALALWAMPAYSDVPIAVEQGVTPTSLGTQDFTRPGFGSPTAAMIVVNRATSTGALSANAALSVGFWADGNAQVVSMSSADNLTTTDSNSQYNTADIVSIPVADGSGDGVARFESVITDGIQIRWLSAPSSAFRITVWMFKADQAAVIQRTTSSVQDVTSKFWTGSWLPNTAITATSFIEPTFPFAANEPDAEICIGFVDWTGGQVTQTCRFLGELDGEVQGNPFSYISTDRAVQRATGPVTLGAGVELSDVNVYTPPTLPDIEMTTRGAADAIPFYALLLDWPDGTDHWVGVETGPTSTGLWSSTSPGFEPQFVGSLIGNLNGTGLLTNNNLAGVFGTFGSAFGNIPMSSTVVVRNNADPTETQNAVGFNGLRIPDQTGADAMVASFSSFDTSGYTLNFTSVASWVTRGMKWPTLCVSQLP